ncbi:hypothetical protein E2566_07995 [Pectobacterium punjabense]|uniref:Reverse transcriptase domain-containing protein n=1 Tax=Pectobacterium punjabense TaxID=2108399 RepID=A0ABX6L0N4_9GAMM|nr:antiviral reverse transcriptase Drt5 [Pectobacterium punjabense]MBS4433293.1 hypothetical protein [Pectobacterium punjabense]PTA64097.1 hypothetical protein C9I36_11310 [Pectobacterium punjabense]QJA19863.1 hypothetical protein E2566_07995 [Pectobacterium punjabense]
MTSTVDFFETDFPATLYPLKTNLILFKNHATDMSDYIYRKVINSSFTTDSFLSQHKVFATKPKGHLRRTVKLDPIAEYFIYDVIYRNRAIFRPEVSERRKSFGYRFKDGSRIPVHISYNEYKQHLRSCSQEYAHNIHFDVASYFNSLYHHDVVSWFESKNAVTATDVGALGQFFREINAGRSIDFMPHGIYPTKMIGNEFLKLIDLHGQLKSEKIVRFMDDFTLFDNNIDVLNNDFIKIQQLLGQVSLNVNPSKTSFDNSIGDIKDTLSQIKASLKEIVTEYEEIPTASGVELVEMNIEVIKNLDINQVNALIELLKDENLEEADADLILGFLRTHNDSLLSQIPMLLTRFPNLIKHIYTVCSGIRDKKELVNVLLNYLNSNSNFLEYQLFWIGAIVEDYLLGEGEYGSVLLKLFELSGDFKISRSKILEIPENGFGLKEIRNGYLSTGQSDWLSWSSAIGSRSQKTGERNYILDYFSKASPINHIIASCVKKI